MSVFCTGHGPVHLQRQDVAYTVTVKCKGLTFLSHHSLYLPLMSKFQWGVPYHWSLLSSVIRLGGRWWCAGCLVGLELQAGYHVSCWLFFGLSGCQMLCLDLYYMPSNFMALQVDIPAQCKRYNCGWWCLSCVSAHTVLSFLGFAPSLHWGLPHIVEGWACQVRTSWPLTCSDLSRWRKVMLGWTLQHVFQGKPWTHHTDQSFHNPVSVCPFSRPNSICWAKLRYYHLSFCPLFPLFGHRFYTPSSTSPQAVYMLALVGSWVEAVWHYWEVGVPETICPELQSLILLPP